MSRQPTARLQLVEFAADFTAKYGQAPTMKQAAQALGKNYPAVKRVVSEHDLIHLFSLRGRRPADAPPPVVSNVKLSPTMRRKWTEAQRLVRATYGEWEKT